jgi:hypothetical protein
MLIKRFHHNSNLTTCNFLSHSLSCFSTFQPQPRSFSFPPPPIPFQAQRRREPRVPNAPPESLVPVIAHRPRAVMVPLPRPTAPRVQHANISTSSRGPGQQQNVAIVRPEVIRTMARVSQTRSITREEPFKELTLTPTG